MKKNKLLILTVFLCILNSCQKENIPETIEKNSISSNESIEQVSLMIDGEKTEIDISVVNGEQVFSQNENFFRLQELMNSENLVMYFDSNDALPLLFSNSSKYNEFISNESNLKQRRLELGRSEETINLNTNNNILPKFTITTAKDFGGDRADISVDQEYSNRHLGFNTCITNGKSFQDNISSLNVEPGLRVRFYNHDDYRGRVMIVDATQSNVAIGWNDLSEIKRGTYTIDNTDDFLNRLCGALFCTSWNDKITSIRAEETGVNGYPLRNTTNVCGSGGSGGSGDSGGNGDNPIEIIVPFE